MNAIHFGNATDKQRAAMDERIRQAVFCQSGLVNSLLQSEAGAEWGYSVDNIRGLYRPTCPECGGPVTVDDDDAAACGDCDWNGTRDACEDEAQEVFEWWLLTDDGSWLAEVLEDAGEVILEADGGFYWGRTCTGQSLSMDPTFWEVWQGWIVTI